MDTPSTRSLRLLALLQSGRDWCGRDLADRLQVSERTVRRDAMRLRDMGYDVRSRPGPGAAYSLRPSMKIPPLLFTADEVATIITSLLILEAWSPDDATAGTARAKLEQVLPRKLQQRAAAVAVSTQVLREPPASVDWHLVGEIADAVANASRLTFDYTDQHGRHSHRTVEPYRHLLRQQRWYLIAYDLTREDWRIFRLDRMEAAAISLGSHDPRAFPWASIEDWLTSNFGASDEHSTNVPGQYSWATASGVALSPK
ncbi:helix-turn-helix transcriptional regulator [Brevibacterium sp. UCMA 11752]|uniref:helix-turn-helix transcriptional regulator n=1 Tax=Brevibacterium sp. UCMA 11752 TaxID=2745946 RepID=UPI001F35D747|nr:WYL domain-containing protein [Brevibacterium sp. UCMA 11752]MCF2586523.1 WYL domain-containing protein [Brevibacterium sp. UCMA 11752]